MANTPSAPPEANRDPAARPAKRPYLHAEDRRRQLLSVAHALVEREGLGRLTISQLAVEAGVTRQTAYHHFADVNELFREVLRERFASMQESIDDIMARYGGDFTLTMRHASRLALELPTRDRLTLRYIFGGLIGDRPELADTLRQLRTLVTSRWCAILFPRRPETPTTRALVWAYVNALFGLYDMVDAKEITVNEALDVMVVFGSHLLEIEL